MAAAQQAGREVGERAREVGERARGEARGRWERVRKHSPGPAGWAAIVAVGGALAAAATVSLVVLAPLLLLFSPILIPLGIILFLCTAGLVATAAALLVAFTAASWGYQYLKGERPPRPVDYAMSRIHETAEQVKHKARDIGGRVQEAAAPGA